MKLKIAICDDSKIDLEYISQSILISGSTRAGKTEYSRKYFIKL